MKTTLPVKKYREFIQQYFSILDKDSQKPVQYKLNVVQDEYYNTLQKEYPGMEGVREIVLKARQEGISSFVLALFTVDFLLTPYSVSICISHRKDSTDLLFKKVKFYIDSYCRAKGIDPKELLKSDNKTTIENASNGAVFYIGTAGAKVGGRGGSARNILFSECLSKNQLVIGENGFVFPITQLPTRIRDGNGALIKPIGLRKIKPTEGMKSIKVYGNFPFPIEATLGHKLWARTGTRQNYKEGWKEVRDITPNDYLGFPITPIKKTPRNQSPFTLSLTKDMGEFCGWYLAEGSMKKGQIDLAIHTKEKEYIDQLLNGLSIKHSFYTRGNGTEVRICNTKLQQEILSFFGEKDNKMIPDKVWGFGKEFIKGLLRGFFLGDGRCKPEQFHQLSLASTRPQLIVQLKRLLISLRLAYPGIQVQKANTQKTRNNKEIWTLTITGKGYTRTADFIGIERTKRVDGRQDGYNKFFHFGEKYFWAKVHSIKDMPLEEYVYDVVLDREPHAFTLLASKSHNCAFYQDTELVTAREIVEGTSQQVPQGKGMIFIESTANGTDNYYQKEWERANLPPNREGKKPSNYQPRFFSWEKFYTKEWIEEKRGEFQSEAVWKQEYPKTPDDAFITSGTPFFDNLILKEMLDVRAVPIAHGKFDPDGSLNLGDDEENSPVKIYRELEYNEQFVVFGDPADSKDFCAAVACSKRKYDCPIVMNEGMESSQFGYELHNMCKYIFNKTGIWPKLAVERNTGQATIYVLKQLNYPDLFRMIDSTSITSNESGGIGWVTTGHLQGGELQGTRRKMLDDLALSIKQGQIKIYDNTQLKQMIGFMIVKGRAQAKSNKKDDLVMATAGAWQVQTLTPSIDFGEWNSESWQSEKNKWRIGQR